ncbi:MAG: nonstructural protein [Microviridae sp.]|nr:MAG: nonstructural protein [Microviridae sp.]
MIYRVVSIRDRVADVFAQPAFVVSAGAAVRSFGDALGKDEQLGAHPEDYDLWEIGAYDDSTAELVNLPNRQLALGKDFKKGD